MFKLQIIIILRINQLLMNGSSLKFTGIEGKAFRKGEVLWMQLQLCY